MATLQEQILARLQVVLAALPGVALCERSRRDGVDRDQTPAITIRPDVEQDERFSDTVDKRTFTAVVTVQTRGQPWDVAADPIVDAAHKAVMRDQVINALALNVRRTAREPEDAAADATAGQYSLHYRFIYLSRFDDLAAQP